MVQQLRGQQKPPARLITLAWGEAYIQKLLELTLPSVLAPGNYPQLATAFDVEFVLITERRFFGVVSAHPTFQRLRRFGATRLLPVDDLLIGPGSYGLTLTLGLFRGLEDLGASMTETTMLFLNADFILADDCYRALVPKLLAGARLVVSPSYCANEEQVVPLLLEHKQGDLLSCPKRLLAEYILRHLHDTVRGQIVDNPFYYDHVYVYQQYVRPDSHILIGHQMPIAIVAMRPTRHVSSMRTFWDFGAASEFCPDVPYCVLGDSDEYLMLELRPRREGRELLRLGLPRPERIARLIGSVLTKDQRELGNYDLILHAKDVSGSLQAARAQLKEFLGQIWSGLPADPSPHVDHPMWQYHLSLYRRKHQETSVQAPLDSDADEAGTDVDQSDPGDGSIRKTGPKNGFQSNEALASEIFRWIQSLERSLTELELESESTKYRQRIHDLRHPLLEMSRLVERVRTLPLRLDEQKCRPRRDVRQLTVQPLVRETSPAVGRVRAMARRLRDKVLGVAPHFSLFHPFRLTYEDAYQLLVASLADADNVLAISDVSFDAETTVRQAGKPCTRIPWRRAVECELYTTAGKFDLACVEMALNHASELPRLFDNLRRVLEDGSRVIVVLTNPSGVPVPISDPDFIDAAFPTDGSVRIVYRGGVIAWLAFRGYMSALKKFRWDQPKTLVCYLAAACACLPLAFLANLGIHRRTTDPDSVRSTCLSATMEITQFR